jgi:ring-1,2-phenylacetyl-CoA epoxidase subunit PaaC
MMANQRINISTNQLINYSLHLADNALILGHRNSEWCGHGPVLEQDIAISNIALDLLGQARNFYQYAAELEGNNTTEDTFAYLRDVTDFKNCLLVELPNGDWAHTILRQFFFSAYQYYLYQQLQNCSDQRLAAIAAKALKEVTYHVRWSSEWVIRLGDGTTESRQRMEKAIAALWAYTGELCRPEAFETTHCNIDHVLIKKQWDEKVWSVFDEATLARPADTWMHSGGREGKHTEHLGYILSEMQFLQRAYPGAEW